MLIIRSWLCLKCGHVWQSRDYSEWCPTCGTKAVQCLTEADKIEQLQQQVDKLQRDVVSLWKALNTLVRS